MANIKNREASLKLGQTNSKCARCGKTVYFAEQVFGAGKKWHKQCFKCVECNKTISSTSLRDKDGKRISVTVLAKAGGGGGGTQHSLHSKRFH